MARRANGTIDLESLGQRIGRELGRIIARSAREALEGAIDVADLARRVGVRMGNGRQGALIPKALCSIPGCGQGVLAKGLCRSHYYRARYRAQKQASSKVRGRRKGRLQTATRGQLQGS